MTTRSFSLSILGVSLLAITQGCSSSQSSRAEDPAPAQPTTTAAAQPSEAPAVSAASLKTDKRPIEGSVALLSVSGLGCPLCANNVDEKLSAVAGVREVSVDLGTGTVTVALAETLRPSRADLARAVEDSGFTLTALAVR